VEQKTADQFILKAKLIKRVIFELSFIVTVNDFQAVEMLIVQCQS
jgi:hypothetical protein